MEKNHLIVIVFILIILFISCGLISYLLIDETSKDIQHESCELLANQTLREKCFSDLANK